MSLCAIFTGMIDIQDNMDHEFTLNYDDSSGAMKLDGLLLVFKEFNKQYKGRIYYNRVVTDDDMKLTNK